LKVLFRKELPVGDRTYAQLRNHYEVEKALAVRLKNTESRQERQRLYSCMYGELFARVPDHPRLKVRDNPEATRFLNASRLKLIRQFIHSNATFVEFGAGDCRFVLSMSERVRFAYGVDIADQMGDSRHRADNFKLIVYNGFELDIPKDSVDIVFSDQLIEHLHPDDTEFHFRLVKSILRQGGVYVFRTPHRFRGPQDISRYFVEVAEGFHLKEWTYSEIAEVLDNVGFSGWWGHWQAKSVTVRLPAEYFIAIEGMLGRFSRQWKRFLGLWCCPSICMVAIK
jgi:SAM-dependent methyltransferase